ncbi:MAG: hypothetical protein WCX17_03870 [Parcubacteria group bacterium]
MKRLRLSKPVTVSGEDFFGRKAKITFYPCYNPGWHWMCGNELIPIASDLVVGDRRRITLGYKKHRLEIYEHIGAIRFTGLDYIAIQSSTWPPYFGRIAEYWEALKPHCVEGDGNIPWIIPRGQIRSTSYKDDSRFVEISPRLFGGLYAFVKVDMSEIGSEYVICELPGKLTDFFSAYTLGWPSWLYYPSTLADKILGWSHHERITWQNNNAKEELLKKIALHRVGDLLGALSLISHVDLISGEVISHRGSHKLDVAIVKDMKSF